MKYLRTMQGRHTPYAGHSKEEIKTISARPHQPTNPAPCVRRNAVAGRRPHDVYAQFRNYANYVHYAHYAPYVHYAHYANYANYAINSTLTLVELSRLAPSPNRRSSPLPPCAARCPELLGPLPRPPLLFLERSSWFWQYSCEGPLELEGRAPLVAHQ